MKRLLCFIIVLNLFLTSCSFKQADNSKESRELTELEKEIMSAPEGEYEKKDWISDVYDLNMDAVIFDDILYNCTDVFKATYKTTRRITRTEPHLDTTYVHEFDVFETYRGKLTSKTIYVILPLEISYMYDIPYESGKSYLLLLTRYSNIFCENYLFSPLSIYIRDVIPLDEGNKPDIANATWNYVDLLSKIGDKTLRSAAENGTFLEAVLKYIKDNPLVFEEDFIVSNDINEIIEQSPYAFEIQTDKLDSVGWNFKGYWCTITQIYKGDDRYSVGDKVYILFPFYEIDAGGKYLILANVTDDSNYSRLELSSRHSVYDVSDTSEIQKIIEILDKSNK